MGDRVEVRADDWAQGKRCTVARVETAGRTVHLYWLRMGSALVAYPETQLRAVA